MTEFLHNVGLLCATVLGAAGVSFGLYAGFMAATWAFGPININIKRGPIEVNVK